MPALVDALGNLADCACYPGSVMTFTGLNLCQLGALLADKAFDADGLVKDLTRRGSKVVIPPCGNRKAPREYDKETDLLRNWFSEPETIVNPGRNN